MKWDNHAPESFLPIQTLLDYVEGKLNQEETRSVRLHLSKSPCDMAVLEGILALQGETNDSLTEYTQNCLARLDVSTQKTLTQFTYQPLLVFLFYLSSMLL